MRVTETTVKKQVITTKFICNKCGKEIDVKNNVFANNEIHSFSICFGYYSNRDGESWKFDLCEDCIVKLAESFKHKPDIKKYI